MMSASRSSSINPPRTALSWSRCRRVRNPRPVQRYGKCGYTHRGHCTCPMAHSARERVAAAYDAHYEALRFIAARRFRVPPADVRALIHDVFVAYIRHVSLIGDDRGWLITATKHACLNYWRDAKPGTPLPDALLDSRALRDDVATRLDLARVLRRVPKDCRTVLWQRYVDGLEPAEIAANLSKAPSGGRQIVFRCLRAAREALASFRRGGA